MTKAPVVKPKSSALKIALALSSVLLFGYLYAISGPGYRDYQNKSTVRERATVSAPAAAASTTRTWHDDLSDLQPYSEAFGREIKRLQFAAHADLPDIASHMDTIQRDIAALDVQPCLRPAIGQIKTALNAIGATARMAHIGNGINDPAIVPMMYRANDEVTKARALISENNCDKG